MKLFKTLAVVMLGLAFSAVTSLASLDFSSTSGSQVLFGPGSQFNITGGIADGQLPGSLAQWQITTPGAADGLSGEFSGGPWSYGAITISDGVQTANVTTPTGGMAIADALGVLLTGNVNWVQISTIGAGGSLNAFATINITDLSYSGVNAALLGLVAEGNTVGSVDLTFQFASPDSLTMLSEYGGAAGSYSGSIAAVPEPTTVIAGALLLLPFGASTLRILRRNRIG